jgi:hypothetical protein
MKTRSLCVGLALGCLLVFETFATESSQEATVKDVAGAKILIIAGPRPHRPGPREAGAGARLLCDCRWG